MATKKPDGETDVLAKIAQMPEPYRAIGRRLHEIIMTSAPQFSPRIRYGMPWYMKDGKGWCFFRAAVEFGFITFGFDDPAALAPDQGAADRLVASAYRVSELDGPAEVKLAAVVRKAASKP